MTKKYLFLICTVAILFTSSVSAEETCNNQAKPALSCPTGYSIMCIPTGGWHWGCGKEGAYNSITEVQGITIEPTTTQEVKAVEPTESSSIDSAKNLEDDGIELETQRVLPTVNKVEDDDDDDDDDGSDERVLPTVNKKEVTIKIEGWEDNEKEEMELEIELEIEDDDAVKEVEITQENVSIKYATKAKLFAFIPITMNMDVSSDAEGRVKVKFPWYKFLAKTDYAKSAEILNYIFQNNETDFEFLKTKGSAKAQLEIFITIKNIMHEMSKSIIQNIKG